MTYDFAGRPVNRIGFGAMQLPGRGAFGPPRDRDEAVRVLRRAVELGVNHIDTAQYYGPDIANELLREALAPFPEDLVLVSKVGAARDDQGGWLPAHSPAQLRAGVEANLRALGVDHLHAVNLRLPGVGGMANGVADTAPDAEFDEQLDMMISLRDAGLIGGIGLSNVSLARLRHALDRTDIVCVQNAYNLLGRGAQPVLDECRARGIAFVPFFPLGAAFTRGSLLQHESVRSVADRLGATPAQVALAWILDTAPNTLLIPGTSTVEHLEENLGAASVRLDDEARSVLAPASAA